MYDEQITELHEDLGILEFKFNQMDEEITTQDDLLNQVLEMLVETRARVDALAELTIKDIIGYNDLVEANIQEIMLNLT